VSADGDELLRRCQRGDADALAELTRLYQDRLFRLACRVLGDPARAEDAVADVMVKLWDRCLGWRGDSSAGTWIYRLALRTVLDHGRARRRWWRLWAARELPDPPDPEPGPEETLAGVEERDSVTRRIHEALARLSPDDRALLHLYYFEQRRLAEIAPLLNASQDALKMRLSRARQRLKPLLGEDSEPGTP
jgi:RNA polymerase sigma-70 factor (ECF subfamily)